MSIMNSSRGHIDGRAKESGESVATGAHKDCPPIFPSLAVQSCDNTIGNDGVASEAVSKMYDNTNYVSCHLKNDLMSLIYHYLFSKYLVTPKNNMVTLDCSRT